MATQSEMNSEHLAGWLRCMVEAMPRGGKSIAAEMLGLSPSGLSKILHDPARAFDQKTINLLAWVQNSRSERYDPAQFLVEKRVQVGPIIVETRVNPAGGTFTTWKKAE